MSPDATRVPPSSPWRPDVRFACILAVVYLLALLPRIFLHDMWRDEWQAWLLAVDGRPGWGAFVRRMGYEGHPMLWHLLLWLLGKVWPDPAVMKLLHSLIAAGIVFLIGGFLPASRAMRILTCIGYFFAFEYAVVSRNYGLGVLCLFAFAAIRTARPGALVAQACTLAIAAQANVYAAVIVSALSLWILQTWLNEGKPVPRRFLAAVAIVGTGLALCALQIKGNADREFAVADYNPSFERFLFMSEGLWRSFFPLPITHRMWWNFNFVEQWVPRTMSGVLPLLGLGTLVLSIWLIPRNRGSARLLWVYCAVALLLFGTTFYYGFLRHQGHFFIAFLLAWWIGHVQSRSSGERRTPRSAMFLVVLLFQAAAGLFAAVADMTFRFTGARDVADFVRQKYPDAVLIGYVDFTSTPIAGFLGRSIYYPPEDAFGTFVYWKKGKRYNSTAQDFTTYAERIRAERPGVEVLAVVNNMAMVVPDPTRYKLVGQFLDSTIYDETYYLYRYQPPLGATRPVENRPSDPD